MGDLLIVYLEQDDFNKGFSEFAASKDSFDVWLKVEIKNATGVSFLPAHFLNYFCHGTHDTLES